MENAIDPTKVDTIPFKLQQLRNQYAAKKRARKKNQIFSRQERTGRKTEYAEWKENSQNQ